MSELVVRVRQGDRPVLDGHVDGDEPGSLRFAVVTGARTGVEHGTVAGTDDLSVANHGTEAPVETLGLVHTAIDPGFDPRSGLAGNEDDLLEGTEPIANGEQPGAVLEDGVDGRKFRVHSYVPFSGVDDKND